MPWTAFFFLIGVLSISSIPPFNGFISEWLTLQSLVLMGISIPGTLLKVVALLAGATLALIGALAAATFVKAFGLTFLAMPRSPKVEKAHEVPLNMRIGMGVMSLACLFLGILPVVGFRILSPVTNLLIKNGFTAKVISDKWLTLIPVKTTLAGLTPGMVLILMLVLLPLPMIITRLVGGRTKTRIDETWTCGDTLRPTMEYTASSFSQPFRKIFSKIFLSRQQTENKYDVAPYFAGKIKYKSNIKPLFENFLYKPFMQLFLFLSGKVRQIQTGSVHTYLAYIFITLVILLLIAR